ncbi:DUF2600 family protein [Limnochorda pilosa]|uniref:Tetraprenyl-beta-curcumene synthase n=1 Tax=Limnochorda pilosa TaxID=1555112 RepID=A0A0K2SIN4_LIMPI|nr:DUF2600 family protein [Limnochorda pilosa]BAS26973.1 tetraprenyl-beta-curcumene synthase [Limnochorda pilosa]
MRPLAGGGPDAGEIRLLTRLFGRVLPQARRELERWTRAARAIPDPHLRAQALASLRFKRFHALGASVFGAQAREMGAFVRFAVAYQTISDYLDNLSDRDRVPGTRLEEDLTLLHQAMIDAVSPSNPASGYYRLHTATDDGGYLPDLVATCREALGALGASGLAPRLLPPAARYARMQALKHLEPHRRAAALASWAGGEASPWPGLFWWEFAASAGSTLGIFALAASAGAPPEQLDRLEAAYVPWVTAYHILLDYLIDLDEDRAGGDLNFVACYPSLDVAARRLRALAGQARRRIEALEAPAFHRLVVHGLTGLYLADAKARAPMLRPVAATLLDEAGSDARALAWLCRWRNPFGQVAEPQPPPAR